jgi:pimeloyl-ACP methyl ester carboxylesterase
LKRFAFLIAAGLALGTATLYYGVPAIFTQPLLALNRSLSGLEEKTSEVAMHTVHYLDSGMPAASAEPGRDGTPIVLLHGIFAEKDHWVDFARPLTSAYRVVAPDLPGFGESTRHDGQRYDYAAQTTRLAAFLDALGIQRAHFAGNSMGGTIAALYAIEHPERVASVAFIGAPHGIRSPQPSTMDQLIDAGQRPLVAHDARAFHAMMELVFEKRPFLPHPILVATEQAALRNATSNERLWDAQLNDRYLLGARLPLLQTTPVLALWGASDRAFHVSGAQTLQSQLPQARVETLPGIGHLPMMEAPGDTAQRYAAFLSALNAGVQAVEKNK